MKLQFMRFCCFTIHCRNAENIYGRFVKERSKIHVLLYDKQQPTEIISRRENTVADRNAWREIQCQIKEMFKDFVAYSFETDENGDVTSFSQLDAFIRGVKEVLQLLMELQNRSL
jgi:hypothetical protein